MQGVESVENACTLAAYSPREGAAIEGDQVVSKGETVRSLDVEMDREGLQGASDAVREAWKEYRPIWRKQRALDLAPEPEPEPARDEWETQPVVRHGMRVARRLGSAFGMCAASQRRDALTPRQRAAWFRWRSRVLRHDPGLWGALWALVDGQGVALVSLRHSVTPHALKARVSVVLAWLQAELYPSTIR